MARSSYIYVVCHENPQNPDPPHVKAAFTVKYEMINWLKRCRATNKHEYVVYRVSDGDRWGTIVSLSKDELKEG